MNTTFPTDQDSHAASGSPEVFQQLGLITRQLHDTLTQLGVMPGLQQAADALPDARSRLRYIARKSGEAAEKVLNSVDQAKLEHEGISESARRIQAALVADPVKAVATGAVINFVAEVESATQRIDAHLTDIMLAQDYHDLTSQVVGRVVTLATELEGSLLTLLLKVAPPEQTTGFGGLNGPVVDIAGRTDVVADQGEVDDLLASLGF